MGNMAECTHTCFVTTSRSFVFRLLAWLETDDSVGFWHVAPRPGKEQQDDWSRVYYSVQVRIPSWVPGIVIGYLNKKAIREVMLRLP